MSQRLYAYTTDSIAARYTDDLYVFDELYFSAAAPDRVPLSDARKKATSNLTAKTGYPADSFGRKKTAVDSRPIVGGNPVLRAAGEGTPKRYH